MPNFATASYDDDNDGGTLLPAPANPDWSVVAFRDSNNNGVLDGADAVIGGAVPVVAGTPITVFLKNYIPVTAANGAQDRLTVTATFTPDNGPNKRCRARI